MFAEIITVGDEILIGQIVDTNSAFIANLFNKAGISIYQITSVQDDRSHIIQALEDAEYRVDIVVITGGLGPTKDDVTKTAICEYFNDKLVRNEEVLKHIEYLFEKYVNTPITDQNRDQALVPSRAVVLKNRFGTAPGMWIESGNTVFVSLPGVPYEMKALMEHEVIPRLHKKFRTPFIYHKTILTYGLGESAIAQKIEQWAEELPPFIKLAYLPNLGKVRLRLTAKGLDLKALESAVNQQVRALYPLIGDIIYGFEEEGVLEEIVGKLLAKKDLTLSTAESCTGGSIAEAITSIPGSSAYFVGSVVCYATRVKTEILGVPKSLIDSFSVVSAEVAEAMALGVQKLLNSDYAIATTGNAGPSKGDSDAEVGTVYIAIAGPSGVFSVKTKLGNHREKVIRKAVHKSLELLQKEILKN
ncbi:competence/damage-inducible protein A [Ascidiimonas aurantiaca]|uniref:competence/damage-inducible protein A n=1 Tax=Ascidiimonas aurantiaca TaxID=1685432 RepID=UPI0030ED1AAE